MSSNVLGLQSKEERVQIVPSFWNCSKAGDDCSSTGCCQVSGHTCFTKGQGKAFCNKTCTPGEKGFTCDVINPHSVPVAARRGQNLYCFSVHTENIGNDKLVNHELELLNIVATQGKGIFACEQWDVFSDVQVALDTGVVTTKVEDKFGEFHQLKRKVSGTWVNWGIFYQVWVKIREVGKWQSADYTIKVDADAVFVPARLRTWLSSKPGDSPHGRLHHQSRRRCRFRPCAFEDLVELQTRRFASRPLLRELSERPVWLLRPPGDHHQNSSRGAHDVLRGLPRRVRTLRKRWLRLEVGRLGRGRLRPEVHGSPLCRQGRGIRRGHRWCVRI